MTDAVPVLANGEYIDEVIHEYISYNLSDGNCASFYDYDFKPLPGAVKTCATSVALNESFYIVSVVLTSENELWVWHKPWVSPYTAMENFAGLFCLSASVGLFVGFLFAMESKPSV